MFKLGYLLEKIPPARLLEEVLKLFMGGCAVQTFERLRHYGLFGYLFPQVEASLGEEEEGFPHLFLVRALENTDARITQGRPVTPGFLFAALLWDPMRRLMGHYQANGLSSAEAMQLAADAVISRQVARIAMPRRFTWLTREIWALQPKFNQRGGKRPLRLFTHPRFRAAYDFLLLRAEVGEERRELAQWWTEFQEADSQRRRAMQSTFERATRRRK